MLPTSCPTLSGKLLRELSRSCSQCTHQLPTVDRGFATPSDTRQLPVAFINRILPCATRSRAAVLKGLLA